MSCVGIEELGGARAEDLEAIVEGCAGREVLGAKAGAWVVDFEELDGLGGVVGNGGFDVGGVAACTEGEAGGQGQFGEKAH